MALSAQAAGQNDHVPFPPSPPSSGKHSKVASDDEFGHSDDELPHPQIHEDDDLFKSYPLPPAVEPKAVLAEDLKTPDNHVERDPRLIRLTGVHPFNTEPPLTDLYNQGFLTNENLHFVRNHGHVPVCEDHEVMDWQFTVDGLVDNPITISVRDLIETFEQVTYPVTLVCAGNRRKEQNTVRKSKGFSWGASGLSTALWTGIPIGELLARAKPKRSARYVCFEGADKLPNGYYGTCTKLNSCMDRNKGIMIAHKMNGRPLHPDHGKPVRIIIPGNIGGRSVKWLKKITLTDTPSDNWYHIYDNRVLPTMITPEASDNLPETWKDERYAIYDLNANSAICYPEHDERLKLPAVDDARTYKVQGYAYGGGGRRISRMEVTLDKGKTWRLAPIHYPEDAYRDAPDNDMLYGGKVDMWWRETCFCWCFWELDIPVSELAGAADIMIRAMDEGMMVQPRDMYWSVLGMMNNPWFRVVIHKEGDTLRFEHPTRPALTAGGWMERVKKEGGDLTNGFWGEKINDDEERKPQEPAKEICMTNPKVDRIITLDELKQHSGDVEPWFVVNGHVYDGTPYLDSHPGGAASIFGAAGQDVTAEFVTIHSENAKAMMQAYHIGTLSIDDAAILASNSEADAPSDPTRAVFLQPKAWSKAILQSKTDVSHDSKIFTFQLDHAAQRIGLPVGEHLLMRLQDPASRESIIRAYTPISYGDATGTLDVLIKIYRDGPGIIGGKLTQALDAVPMGHPVDFKGPVGKFEYLGNGKCNISGKIRHVTRFIMVCGGSGVTPIFQVLRALAEDPLDKTTCIVIDGNKTEKDILCRAELDALVEKANGRAELVHILNEADDSWKGLRGRMDMPLFEERVGQCKQNDGSELILVCGPPPLEKCVKGLAAGLGWRDEDLLLF